MRFTFIILSLVGSLSTVGCNRIPPEYQAFLDLPVSEQHRVMMELPLDKRIDYYLAGMRYIEPPQIALADDVASEGKRALPFLVKRLREDKDERNQANVVLVFGVMHSRFYKLKNETEALTALSQTVNSMKTPRNRKRSEETLNFIQTDQLPDFEKALTESNGS